MTNAALPPTGPRTQGSAVRPRYGRISAFGGAVLVSAVSLLGGTGVLPTTANAAQVDDKPRAMRLSDSTSPRSTMSADTATSLALRTPESRRATDGAPAAQDSPETPDSSTGAAEAAPLPDIPEDATTKAADPSEFPLPKDSGEGRRVVFDLGQQRVWLVGDHGKVRRTYLASGSVTDNLKAGTYGVYSRSLQATGIDGSSMRYMIRFTRGDNAAIGFHDVPLDEQGHPVQRVEALGTPLSHGCIRQAPADARRLWRFAPVGTFVVVTGTRRDG